MATANAIPAAVPALDPIAEKYRAAEFVEAQKAAHQRLYPSIFQSSYITLRNRRRRVEKFFAQRNAVGKVLDVGAQYCPYYPLFKDKCESYTSLDIVETPIVDIVSDASSMPVEGGSFDLVLCTEVLEHSDDPQAIVNECHRVLKTGGILIVTVPTIFPQHGYPADNWRFMPDGLKHLMRAFANVSVIGELDFPETFFSVVDHFGHVFTGRMGALGRALNIPWDLSMNLAGMFWSALLRPFANTSFTGFPMSLWVEGRK